MHEQTLFVAFRPGFLSLILLLQHRLITGGQEEKVSSRQETAAL